MTTDTLATVDSDTNNSSNATECFLLKRVLHHIETNLIIPPTIEEQHNKLIQEIQKVIKNYV
jgi:hypothetical protein